MSSFGFFGISIDDSGYFLIQDAIVDIGFFGMKIFIKGSPHYAIAIDRDPKLGSHLRNVSIVLAITTLVGKDEQVATGFHIPD